MILKYKFFGLIADFAILFNVILLVSLLSIIEATLTMPGIAGIVLTVGMAVDANVLVFERIKEELRSGRSIINSIDLGYKFAFKTILDANITTLIAALLLYNYGSGPIKGVCCDAQYWNYFFNVYCAYFNKVNCKFMGFKG